MDKKIQMNNNFISNVIFKIKFQPIEEILCNNKNIVDEFFGKISKKFPIKDVSSQHNSKQITQNTGKFWIFKNNNHKRIVNLTSNSLVLEYKEKEYSNFENFLNEVLFIISAFNNFDYKNLEFLGLRYINQVTNEKINRNIGDYFNPNLTNMAIMNNIDKNDEELIQIFSKINSKKDDYLINMQYGLFNPSFPNLKSEKYFILDYDCVICNINSTNEIKTNLINMHDLILDKFDYSITSKFEKLIDGDG